MGKLTKRDFENHWQKIGYEVPRNGFIQKLHKGYYKVIRKKITDVDQIVGAFFASTKDRNGFSMGIFMACTDCFAYAAVYPDRDVVVLELFPYTKIESFATALSAEKEPTTLVIKIYDKEVQIVGHEFRIPDAFLINLKQSGVLQLA